MPRTILIHLNVELPDDLVYVDDGPVTAGILGQELEGVLEVGIDPDETPALAKSKVVVALAEEV